MVTRESEVALSNHDGFRIPRRNGALFNPELEFSGQHVPFMRFAAAAEAIRFDEELELVGCSTGINGRLWSTQNLVDKIGGAPEQIGSLIASPLEGRSIGVKPCPRSAASFNFE